MTTKTNPLAVMDVHAMQVRFFELMRKRRFEALHYVPNEREAPAMYVREENGNHYPARSLLRCPVEADNVELRQLGEAIEAAGVRMYL